MKWFSDMPTEFRLQVRGAVEDNGGMVAGYYDGFLQVALPASVEACDSLTAALRELGILGEDRITWFPLGTDNPPESLRHYGIGTVACPRGDRPNYWKYRNYQVSHTEAALQADMDMATEI